MRNTNYVVTVNWLDFEFTDPFQAMRFAEESARHMKKDNPRVSIDLHIEENECCECCECCECEEEDEEDAE